MEELGVRQLSFDDILETPTVSLGKRRIAITGFLAFKREMVIKWITDCGGVYCTTVSTSTDYLVVGRIRRTKNMKSDDTRKLRNAHKIIASDGKIQLLSQDVLFRSLELSMASHTSKNPHQNPHH